MVRRPGIPIGLLLLAVAPMPSQGAVTGEQLRLWCEAWDRVFVRDQGAGAQDAADGASCSAYIAGTLEGAAALRAQSYGVERSREHLPAIGLCHPRERGYRPVIEAVGRYLRANPERRDQNAATLVLEAIEARFPCEQA